MIGNEVYILKIKGEKPRKQPLGQLIAMLHNRGLINLTDDKYWHEYDNGFKITYSRNLKAILRDLDKIKTGEFELIK